MTYEQDHCNRLTPKATAQPENAMNTPRSGTDPVRNTLFPRIDPYSTRYLQVSTLHRIYYEISGNPLGLPVCFIHGGPGGGTESAHRRFFNPEIYKIILIDQRGCGKSTPHACLHENTTWHLVDDMNTVRKDCGVDKWILFGGSWGSTLAITYAQEHADNVLGMILRGIFLSRSEELEWLYERYGIGMLYPEAFKKYLNGLPVELRNEKSLMSTYYNILSKNEVSEQRRIAANAWSQWEYTLSSFPRNIGDEIIIHNGCDDNGSSNNNSELLFEYNDNENLAFARIESHYFVNMCFFKDDGLLLKKERMDRIKNIKTFIVQGRWDFVCPRKSAYDLANMFDKRFVKTYIIDNAGHSTFEPGIEQALLKAAVEFGQEFPKPNDSTNKR